MKAAAIFRQLSPISHIGPLLVGNYSPTASLYFENSCADWLSSGRVQKIAPTVFASAQTQIIFRHDTGVPMGFSRPNYVYFMDDYWGNDPDLPWQYRLKSKLVERRAARYYLSRANNIGVSSARLRQIAKTEFPNAQVNLVHPYWSEKMADLRHFDQAALKICFLGARSHSNDLKLVLPAIRAVLQKRPEAQFFLSDQHKLPIDLRGHPQVNFLPTMDWQTYRRQIVKHRFHIALYPLQPSEFNKARSDNKLLEHAIVGAATLCSDHWLNRSARVISVADGANNWRNKLLEVSGNGILLRRVALENKMAIENTDRANAQRSYWGKLLFPK